MQIRSERGGDDALGGGRRVGRSSPTEEQASLVMEEAVRNAVAHSGCGRIEVSVDVDDAEFRGRVEDDGKGFDPHGGEGVWHDDRGDGEPAAGVGLRSMRERTDALGGLLDVSSEPGRGSALEVCIPLADRPLFTEPRRRISMKMSRHRAALKRGSVTQHRPHYVDPPTRQRDQSLSVSLAFSSLAIIEGSGLRSAS
jgi:anti-sigma regulatory factor (Ser/Thr protein kinase)